MAAPVSGKCVAVIALLVVVLYTGCAFKLREAGHVDQKGTCSSGKCSAAASTHLHQKKLDRVSVRGTFAKIHRPPVDNDNEDNAAHKERITKLTFADKQTNEDSNEDEDVVIEDEVVDDHHLKKDRSQQEDEDSRNEDTDDTDDDDDEEEADSEDDQDKTETEEDSQELVKDDSEDETEDDDKNEGSNEIEKKVEEEDSKDSGTNEVDDDDDDEKDSEELLEEDEQDSGDKGRSESNDKDDCNENEDDSEHFKEENSDDISTDTKEEKEKEQVKGEEESSQTDSHVRSDEDDKLTNEDVKTKKEEIKSDSEEKSEDNCEAEDESENVNEESIENTASDFSPLDELECSTNEDEKEEKAEENSEEVLVNLKETEKEKDEAVKKNVKIEKINSPTQLERKLEKVKFADKDKAGKANVTTKKYSETSPMSNTKEGPSVQPTKLPDRIKQSEAAKPMPKIDKANDPASLSSKPGNIIKSETTKVMSSIASQSTALKTDKQKLAGKPIETTKKANNNKSQQNDSKHATGKPKKRSDGPITLAELNDAILSVPTFVLNFTAVEDSACQQHGKIFLRQLRGFKLWALQMLDSTAKIPAGLLRGNVNQFGDFDQCLGISTRVKISEQIIKIQGKYCLATVDLHAIRPHMKVPENLMQGRAFIRGNMHDPGHFIPRFTTINWALCLPAACSADDAKKAVEGALHPYNLTSGIKFSVDVDPDMCYVKQKTTQGFSKETIGVLYFYAMIVCLVITASVRDYFAKREEKGNYAERIIMSFSLQRNIRALLKDNAAFPEDVTCIHGIRSLSTVALYIAHKLIPTSRMPYANRVTLTEVANNPISSILRVSLVYTDSFLLLSGVLTAYNMAKEFTLRGEIRWFCRLVTRYIRLTPSLLVIIFWYTFVMEHVGSGPQWNSVIKANADICKKNAWTNLLYIQNFFPFEEMCASHTHQLALDMQLSLVAPILVYFLRAKPVIGALLVFFLLQVSATLRYFAVVYNNLSLVIFHGMTLKQLYKTANLTYIISIHRATPYLFGVVLGVFIQYTGKHVRIHKVFVIIGWIVSLALGSWSIFSPWRLARRDYTYDVEDAASYAVISPIVSSLSLVWIIFACFTNHGGIINEILSNYWLIVFSRISYAIYLSQFAVFFYNVASTRYSSEFEILKAINFQEFAAVIFISVVITLFFDIPMQEVKNVLLECTYEGSSTETVNDKNNELKTETIEKLPRDSSLDSEIFDEEESKGARLRRQDARKASFFRSDAYDSEDMRQFSQDSSMMYDEDDDEDLYIRERYARLSRDNDLDLRRRDRSSSRASNRSNKEDYNRYQKIDFRDRPSSLDSEEGQSWEFVRTERSLSKNKESRKSREYSPRLNRLFVSKLVEQGPPLVGDEDNLIMNPDKKPAVIPRVSDDEDWDDDLRIRRGSNSDVIKDEEMDSLKRRSSAEGKIALLQDPIDSGSIDFWTVSKVSHLGSSLEPSEPEDEGLLKKEPLELSQSEDDGSLTKDRGEQSSLTSDSQVASTEEEDVTGFDFVLRKNSKRITVQDLSKLSPDRQLERTDELDSIPRAASGLFKRESIIKSQASEEDPEYLLPERPKLQEQDEDHPFKKAWQQQKSRSEEDGSVSYAIKETKNVETTTKSDNDSSQNDAEPSGEKAIEYELNYNWQGRSIEIEEVQASSKLETVENPEIVNSTSEEERFWSCRVLRQKKKAEDDCILWEVDDQHEC